MKKFKLFAIAAAALVLGTTSCNKENQGAKGDDQGKESIIELALHFPKSPGTRAGADGEAKAGEADVKNVNLFVYLENGTLYKVITLGPGDFQNAVDQATHDYYEMKASSKISIPTGAKKFFVGINLTSAMVDKIKTVNGKSLDKVAVTFTHTELTDLNTGLAMFSNVQDKTIVLSTTGVENKLTLDVERLVSKVTAEFNSTTLDLTGAGGAITSLEFGVNNFNLKSFVAAAADAKDPNWATGSFVAADFANSALTDYATVLDVNGITVTPDSYNPCYANENTSEDKTKEEITRTTVRGKYVPSIQHTYDGTNVTIVTVPATAPATFYAIQIAAGGAWYYFYDNAEANAFKTDKAAATMNTYTDGYCYWNVYLNKAAGVNQWDVIRNNHFQIKINSILGIGTAGPEIVGPGGQTPDEESNILFDINVKNWKAVTTQVEDLTQQ